MKRQDRIVVTEKEFGVQYVVLLFPRQGLMIRKDYITRVCDCIESRSLGVELDREASERNGISSRAR
jgi:hypothetical protein